MKHYLHIILILVLFVLSQVAASVVALFMMGVDFTAPDGLGINLGDMSPVVIGRATLVASAVVIIVMWLSRLAGRKVLGVPKTLTPVAALLSVIGFLLLAHGISFMTLPLGLDDFGTTEQFEGMTKDFLSVLAVCIVVPMAEETVFRAGVLRKLREAGCGKWVAIVTTAVVFGVFHGNPLQAVPAVLMGIALGWLYTKTNSLVLCLLAHIANNSLACVELLFPQFDAYTKNLSTLTCIIFGVCFAYFGIRLLTGALKKVEPDDSAVMAEPTAAATDSSGANPEMSLTEE